MPKIDASPVPPHPLPGTTRSPTSKQAVVLVHGMGEQMPMETLRGFVDAVWVDDPGIDARGDTDAGSKGNPIWWKPDSRTGSLELSRITTRHGTATASGANGPRTEFYEFYWADLTDANTIEQLKDWFGSLLFRSWGQVPPDVRSVWLLLWGITLLFGALALWKLVATLLGVPFTGPWALILAIGAGLYTAIIGFVISYFGDVARYCRAKPPNIAARRAVRERGLALLHAISDSGQYDRIVLVGHSLGTIVAYDLLKFLWSERGTSRTMTAGDALHTACRECHTAGLNLDGSQAALDRFRECQHAVFRAMQRPDLKEPWLITDFVTMGSPLGHAEFLLAHDRIHLEDGIKERRFPTSPPVDGEEDGFLYRSSKTAHPDTWQAHHAAPFAAVRWTNIHDPHERILLGDLISGPVTQNFGPGVEDISIRMNDPKSFLPRLFTHTKYWSDLGRGNDNLDVLRKALRLAG